MNRGRGRHTDCAFHTASFARTPTIVIPEISGVKTPEFVFSPAYSKKFDTAVGPTAV